PLRGSSRSRRVYAEPPRRRRPRPHPVGRLIRPSSALPRRPRSAAAARSPRRRPRSRLSRTIRPSTGDPMHRFISKERLLSLAAVLVLVGGAYALGRRPLGAHGGRAVPDAADRPRD